LISIGHEAFLDEAKEIDGETRIVPGSRIQNEIDEALEQSNFVLLIDTPSAPESKSTMHEVETAESRCSQFCLSVSAKSMIRSKDRDLARSLLALQRWVQLEGLGGNDAPPLSDGQLDRITSEIEEYLFEIFKRKCRVPFIGKGNSYLAALSGAF
jgi:hypothetical protein